MTETRARKVMAQFRSVPRALYKMVPALVGTPVYLDQPVDVPELYCVQHSLCSRIVV